MDEVSEKPWRAAARNRGARLKWLREQKGLTQAGLATMAHTSQQTIDRLERGDVRDSLALRAIIEILKFDNDDPILPEAERSFKAKVREAAANTLNDFSPAIQRMASIPLYAQGVIRQGHILDEAMSYIWCPEPLSGVKDAYALLYSDYDMSPVFGPGDTLLIHPYLPAKAGSDVLYRSAGGVGMVRTCVAVWDDHHRVKQWLPPAESDAFFEEWPIRHTIVGRFIRS